MGRVKDKVAYFKKQHYEDLRKHHTEENTLFIDPTFPAVDAIIGTSSIPSNILWKRPPDLTSDPRLFVDIETSRAVRPGELSSNWIVSACAVLAGVRELCNRVIPDYWEQEWPKNYCGIFHFQFWRFGVWTHVVVDDLLPTVDGVLLTTQAEAENEFWAPLLEKAYAKLHGSYDALRESLLCDALVDFTGGVSEVIDLNAEELSTTEEKQSALLDMLFKEIADHSIMCFTVVAPTPSEIGTRTPLGLCKGHAYHVTGVKRVLIGETGLRALFKGREKVPMIRLRDPIEVGASPLSANRDDDAPESDAQFAFSTSSLAHLLSTNSEWAKVRGCDRQRLGLHVNEKSEFWMPLEDVVSQFTELTICRLLNRNIFQLPGKTWVEVTFVDHWRNGLTGTSADRSGGAEETMLRNPQYMCDIEKPEEEILVQLMQFHDDDTESRGFHNLLIGFSIIKVEENRKTRLHKLWDHCVLAVKIDHKRTREVNYRGVLATGRYIIVPTTYKAGDTAGYMLRVFSQSDLNLRELCQDIPKGISPCSCFSADYEWVTVITIHKAEGLAKPGRWNSLNPYCIITCEGTKVKTPIARDDPEPTWNASYIFYRKKIDKPILIQLYNHNSVLLDSLIGETELPAVVTHRPTVVTSVLMTRIKSLGDDAMSVPSPGTLHITTLTEDNIMAV